METFSKHLARLRAHIGAQRALPLDLGMWAIDELSRIAGSAELRQRRNDHLCRAGTIIGGSVRNQALGIIRVDAVLERRASTRNIEVAQDCPIRSEIEAARLIAPIPAERQLRAILAHGDIEISQLEFSSVLTANYSRQNLPHGQHLTRNS